MTGDRKINQFRRDAVLLLLQPRCEAASYEQSPPHHHSNSPRVTPVLLFRSACDVGVSLARSSLLIGCCSAARARSAVLHGLTNIPVR